MQWHAQWIFYTSHQFNHKTLTSYTGLDREANGFEGMGKGLLIKTGNTKQFNRRRWQ